MNLRERFEEKFGNTWDYTKEHEDWWLEQVEAARKEERKKVAQELNSTLIEDLPVFEKEIRKETRESERTRILKILDGRKMITLENNGELSRNHANGYNQALEDIKGDINQSSNY